MAVYEMSKTQVSAEVRGSRGSFSLGFCAPQLRATSKTLRSAICFCTPGGRPWLRCPRTPAYNGSPQARCPQTLACSGGPRAGAHGPPRIVEVRKHGARALPRYAHRPPRTAEVRGYSAHEPPTYGEGSRIWRSQTTAKSGGPRAWRPRTSTCCGGPGLWRAEAF